MKTVTLTNDYHGSRARVRCGELSEATVRRTRQRLCGISDCTCSGRLGTRGHQEEAIIEGDWRDGRTVYVVEPRP